jgi:hypothetical protein
MNHPTGPADENEQLHRYEITTAMNHVIRACQDVVREHSHRGFWTPQGTTDPLAPSHHDLIDQAREDVLNRLQLAVQAAETVAYEIERHRQRLKRRRKADNSPQPE